MARFVCPHWHEGQACKPYFHVSWAIRLLICMVGIAIAMATPVLNCVNAISASPPAAPLQSAVWMWGAILTFIAIGSAILTLYHEKDIWGSFVAGLGTPGFFIALISLPHLVGGK